MANIIPHFAKFRVYISILTPANMQFEEQEYYEIKKLIIEWILNSLR